MDSVNNDTVFFKKYKYYIKMILFLILFLQDFKCPRCNSGFIEEMELPQQQSFSDQSNEEEHAEVDTIREVSSLFHWQQSFVPRANVKVKNYLHNSYLLCFFFYSLLVTSLELFLKDQLPNQKQQVTVKDKKKRLLPQHQEVNNVHCYKVYYVQLLTWKNWCNLDAIY